jgi:NAD(P)H-hydrate epimerase
LAVRVLAVGDPQRLQGDAALAHAEAWPKALPCSWSASELRGVVVDALLGTGLTGDVREPYAVRSRRSMPAACRWWRWIFLPGCVPIPAMLGVAVRADLTVTFIGLKLGLFTGDAADQVGRWCSTICKPPRRLP